MGVSECEIRNYSLCIRRILLMCLGESDEVKHDVLNEIKGLIKSFLSSCETPTTCVHKP